MKKYFCRLWPRSLRAQIILLVLGLIVLVQVATFTTVTWSWHTFTRDAAVDLTATTVRTLRQALAQVPDTHRADFVNRASGGQWRLWSRSLPSHTRFEFSRHKKHKAKRDSTTPSAPSTTHKILQPFVDALNEKLDDDTRVALSKGKNPRLYISLLGEAENTAATNKDWLVIPIEHISPPLGTPIIVLWLAGTGAILLLAGLFAWHISRPLTDLARAADQLAAGQPQRVQPSGPHETRVLAQRFNLMLDTLAESNAIHRTFLAGLPHDLKGPLARMWLRIEMLDDALIQEGLRNDVKDMQRMIDLFLGFVRGSDPEAYTFSEMDIFAWLEEKVASWRSSGCDITFYPDTNAPVMIQGDALSLSRLFDNLVTNAQHHGKEPIHIGLSKTDKNALLSISDHGTGIQAERRNEALRPFSRLDDARTRTGSVGLGLALASAITQAHQGSIKLTEHASGGLQVNIYLPLAS